MGKIILPQILWVTIVGWNTKVSAAAQDIYSSCILHITFLGMGKEIVFSTGFYGARVIYPLFFQKARRLWDLEPPLKDMYINNMYNGPARKVGKAK